MDFGLILPTSLYFIPTVITIQICNAQSAHCTWTLNSYNAPKYFKGNFKCDTHTHAHIHIHVHTSIFFKATCQVDRHENMDFRLLKWT